MTVIAGAMLLLVVSLASGAFSTSPRAGEGAVGDLAVGKVTPSVYAISQGASLSVALRLRNSAAAAVRRPQVRVLLSTDKRMDKGDTLLARAALRQLAARSSRRLRLAAGVPAASGPGAYWLIVCASAASPERNRTNNCASAPGRLVVNAAARPTGLAPQPPAPAAPVPPGEEAPTGPVVAKFGACKSALAVSAQAGQPSVVEGEEIEYSASVRNDPVGACLEVAGEQTVGGTIETTTSIADLAMWIEVRNGGQRDVLPSSSGLTTSGAAAPEACPGGDLSGCDASIQGVVGNVFYAEGKARSVEPGETAEIPFRFFPTFFLEDLERIADAPAGGVRLVVAAETDEGDILVSSRPVSFTAALPVEDVDLEADLPGGETQVSTIGSVEAGAQVDLDAAAFYLTSTEDPDTVTASFQAKAEAPEPVSSSTVSVSTVVTNDPASRPDVFPTASPSAATIGTTPTVLVGVALNGSVEEEPTVVLDGPETNLGTLNDEGNDGDAVAGDGIWSGQVQVPLTETRTLRVDVLLDGLNRSGLVEVEALPAGAPTEPAPTSDPETIVTGDGATVLRDRIVIRMAEGSPYSDVLAAAESIDGSVVGRLAPDTWQVAIPPVADESSLNAVLAEVSSAAGVIGAEAEQVFESTDVVPNDPLYGSQSYLTQIEANRAWIVARGGSSRVVVAIIDTGVDRDHPDLSSRLVGGTDLAEDDSSPEDTCGHGTHVAGIVGAATNNGLRVAGVNWNAALMPIKVFPDVAGPPKCGYAVDEPAAIRWAVDHGARVINMSLGGSGRSEALVDALQYAWNAGRVVVAAAGNNGSSTKAYPAGYERTEEFSSFFGLFKRTYHTDVIAVGNVTSSDTRAPSSNFGSWVDIAAPGTNILSTYLSGGTASLTGTSMASPVVAGLASLMIGNGVYGPERIRTLLVNTGKPLNQSVGPRVNAFEAVFNGSFEGGLETWSPTGTVTTVPRLGPIVPRAGARMLSMSTGPAGAQTRATVRKVMQIPNNALRNNSVKLSLQYDYVTEEYPEFVGSQFNDSLTIVAHLPNGETRTLADESVNTTNWTPVSGIDFPGGDSTVGQSGWKTAAVTIPASALGGSGDLTIEVFDLGDAIYDSVALVDAVRLD